MTNSQAQRLHQSPPWTVFQQVGHMLKQMVEPNDLMVTEEMLSSSKLDASRADRFVVLDALKIEIQRDRGICLCINLKI